MSALPLSPEQQAWVKARGGRVVSAVTKNGPRGKQCRDCRCGLNHPFSRRYFYCTLRSSSHTPEGYAATKRTNTCDEFTAK